MRITELSTGDSTATSYFYLDVTSGSYAANDCPIVYSDLKSITAIDGSLKLSVSAAPVIISASGSFYYNLSGKLSTGDSISYSIKVTVSKQDDTTIAFKWYPTTCALDISGGALQASTTYNSSIETTGITYTMDISGLTTSYSGFGTRYRTDGNSIYVKDGTITTSSGSCNMYMYILFLVTGSSALSYGNLSNSGASIASMTRTITNDTTSIIISSLQCTFNDAWVYGIGA